MAEVTEVMRAHGVMVVVGVITAIAINLVNQYLQQNAILAARAEVQKLLLAVTNTASQNPTNQKPYSRPLSHSIRQHHLVCTGKPP